MDLLLDPWLRIARCRVRYLDSTGVSSAPFTGKIRTASLGGDRLAASVDFSTAGGQDPRSTLQQARLYGLLFGLRGRQNRVWMHDHSAKRRGAFCRLVVELLANPTFEDGLSSWISGNADLHLSVQDRMLRAYRSGLSADYSIQAGATTVVNGAAYVLRVFTYARKGPLDYRLQLGTSAGAGGIAATGSDITAAGMQVLVGVASGSTMHASILDGISGRSVGDYYDIPYVSLTRCALVNGGSQLGSVLNIDALPASLDGAFLPGDQFQVITSRGPSLHVCTAATNSSSGGAGTLHFEPPLRAAPTDNSPVIVHQPMTRYVFTGELPEWQNEPGVFTNASADFEEDA